MLILFLRRSVKNAWIDRCQQNPIISGLCERLLLSSHDELCLKIDCRVICLSVYLKGKLMENYL